MPKMCNSKPSEQNFTKFDTHALGCGLLIVMCFFMLLVNLLLERARDMKFGIITGDQVVMLPKNTVPIDLMVAL